MRILKLTLITLAAMIAFSASASALTVKKRIEAPGLPDEVWAVAGADFCAIKAWHPAVVECEEVTEGGDTYRVLTLGDGAKLKEKLTDKDAMSYNYVITEGPLPIKNYTSKLWVEEDDEPDRTVIFWQSEFDADGTSDEEATKIISGILKDGVKGIKKNSLAAWDAREEAKGNVVSKGRARTDLDDDDDDDDDDD